MIGGKLGLNMSVHAAVRERLLREVSRKHLNRPARSLSVWFRFARGQADSGVTPKTPLRNSITLPRTTTIRTKRVRSQQTRALSASAYVFARRGPGLGFRTEPAQPTGKRRPQHRARPHPFAESTPDSRETDASSTNSCALGESICFRRGDTAASTRRSGQTNRAAAERPNKQGRGGAAKEAAPRRRCRYPATDSVRMRRASGISSPSVIRSYRPATICMTEEKSRRLLEGLRGTSD